MKAPAPGPLVENQSCVQFLNFLYVTLKIEKKIIG